MEPVTTALLHSATAESTATLRKEAEGFWKAVLGEPARAVGGLLTDKVNKRRHANLVKITVEAKRNLASAGVSPKEVPLKIIHPMIEAASLEEDPDMQARWASLLATAADPRAEALPPSFPKILSEMSSREAVFLDHLHDHLTEAASRSVAMAQLAFRKPMRRVELLELYITTPEFDVEAFNVDVDSLLRFRLLAVEAAPIDAEAIRQNEPLAEDDIYRMTSLGLLFVNACRGRKA
jgi:hypothetical protein